MAYAKPQFNTSEVIDYKISNKPVECYTQDIKEGILSDIPDPEPFDPITGITPNSLHGNRLINRTVTRDKIAFNTITRDEIASNTITGDKIASPFLIGRFLQSYPAGNINVERLFGANIRANNFLNSSRCVVYPLYPSTFPATRKTLANSGTEIRILAKAYDLSTVPVLRTIGTSANIHDLELSGYPIRITPLEDSKNYLFHDNALIYLQYSVNSTDEGNDSIFTSWYQYMEGFL